jgi:predicted nucleic acid-binding protein
VNQPDAFLDTSVLLRHILNDHGDHSPRATALIREIERGHRTVQLSDTVVFESAFVLGRQYGMPRSLIQGALKPIINLPCIVLPGKSIYQRVFELFTLRASLSFADCYHLALTESLNLNRIIAFDRDLGTIPGVIREEP